METKCDGHPRFSIKPLEDQLPFDKVRSAAAARAQLVPAATGRPPAEAPAAPQGFYVFIRALQLLTVHNKGVVLVRPRAAASPGYLGRRRRAPPPL